MTRREFIVHLKRLIREFEAQGGNVNDPETLHDWMDYFTSWLP